MGILENKKARESAAIALEFILEIEVNDVPMYACDRFLEIIRDKLIERCPLPESDGPKFEPMSDVQARMFGDSLMPFGRYVNRPINCVPMSYMQFLVGDDGNAGFIEKLNRYLASPGIQLEQ